MKKNNNIVIVGVGLAAAYWYFEVYNKKTTPQTTPQTTPATNTNITTYANNYTYNATEQCLFDANGYLIGDGVSSYDNINNIVIFSNGYKLNLTLGTLMNSNGIAISQAINQLNFPLQSKDSFGNIGYFPVPKKIVGYSSINNIYFYNENDLTPYSLLDGSFYFLSVLYAESYAGASLIPGEKYTNTRVYNAQQFPLQDINKVPFLTCLQSQNNKAGNVFTYTWNIQDGGQFFLLFSLNYPNVFYDASDKLRGAGVVQYNAIQDIIFFDDNNYLDLKANILYNKSGQSIATNCTTYISSKAWVQGVGIQMVDIGSGRLAQGAMADGGQMATGAGQINFINPYYTEYIL